MSEEAISLEELHDQVIKVLHGLNQASVEWFNNNYDQFFQLSSIIAKLKQPLDRLTEPLLLYREKLVRLCQQFDQYIATIDDKQEQLMVACQHKDIVARFQLLLTRIIHLERAIEDIDWMVRAEQAPSATGAGHQDMRIVIQFDLLERVSIELHYLARELDIIPPWDDLYRIRKQIETSLSSRQKQLDTWFESAFIEAVDLNQNSHIDLVVRTYEQKDEIAKLDLVFRSNVVRPYLIKLITDANVKESKNLDTLYRQMEQFIDSKSNLIRCEFARSCCWRETLCILERLTSLYSLDDLELFKTRYTSTVIFLGRHKDLSDAQIRQVLDRFNLKSYFKQRYYQIATSVEDSLTKDPLIEFPSTINHRHLEWQPSNNNHYINSDINNDSKADIDNDREEPSKPPTPDNDSDDVVRFVYKLKVCNDIHQWITTCWSPEIYIPQLCVDFHKLVCQILNRLALWLSRLRLSDFKIQGQKGQTNFFAEHKAVMMLLIQDCNLLIRSIGVLIGTMHQVDESRSGGGDDNLGQLLLLLYGESFQLIKKGLANVHSLLKLIEK